MLCIISFRDGSWLPRLKYANTKKDLYVYALRARVNSTGFGSQRSSTGKLAWSSAPSQMKCEEAAVPLEWVVVLLIYQGLFWTLYYQTVQTKGSYERERKQYRCALYIKGSLFKLSARQNCVCHQKLVRLGICSLNLDIRTKRWRMASVNLKQAVPENRRSSNIQRILWAWVSSPCPKQIKIL